MHIRVRVLFNNVVEFPFLHLIFVLRDLELRSGSGLR